MSGQSSVFGASFNRPADTNAYAIGDLIANSVTAGSVLPMSIVTRSAGGILNRVRLKVNDTAWKGGTIRVHLFNSQPTVAVGDNGALNTGETYAFTESNHLGYVDVTLAEQTSDGFAKGFASWQVIFDVSGFGIYALLESRSAPTPGSAKTFTLALEIAGD
jgi:hypothetical protein